MFLAVKILSIYAFLMWVYKFRFMSKLNDHVVKKQGGASKLIQDRFEGTLVMKKTPSYLLFKLLGYLYIAGWYIIPTGVSVLISLL